MAEQPHAIGEKLMTAVPVTIYTTRFCPFCIRAKRLLDSKRVSYHEIAVDRDPDTRADMQQKAGSRSVPQIWINDSHIGGCDELYQLESQQKLDDLLGQNEE